MCDKQLFSLSTILPMGEKISEQSLHGETCILWQCCTVDDSAIGLQLPPRHHACLLLRDDPKPVQW